MRIHSIAAFSLALVFASCANEGVVVRKDSGPLPFYDSLGVDGSYKLALRDSTGAVHSQLVTPQVFEDYAEGDYFNDLQPPASADASSANKGMAGVGLTSGNGSTLAARGSANGHANKPNIVAHAVASAPPTVAHRPANPAADRPAVTAHFSAPIQVPQNQTAIAAKAPVNHQAIAAQVAPKPAVIAAAPTSRRSTHLAANHAARNWQRSPSGALVPTRDFAASGSRLMFSSQTRVLSSQTAPATAKTPAQKSNAAPTKKKSSKQPTRVALAR